MRFAAAVLLSFALSSAALADEIRIEGGGTSISTVFQPIRGRFQVLHGHTLNIVQSSAIKGLIALQEGRVDVATGAHPLEDLVAGAAKEGVVIDKSALVATPIEENELVVIANKSNGVSKLSREQLKQLFTGKVADWKQLGGASVPVQVVWGKDTRGQNMQFTRMVLDGENVAGKIQEASTYRDIQQRVAATPGAIGVIPINMNTPATRMIQTVSIKSPIFVITRGAPSPKVQEILDFYRKEWNLLNE
ncbi:MAG TPA: substrate-binding domain-containing protein [Verrucomicrobiae bacterium]|nr:substrate-binding domain-containing protein [Verrucomicrobiae bacterium]